MRLKDLGKIFSSYLNLKKVSLLLGIVSKLYSNIFNVFFQQINSLLNEFKFPFTE